MAKDTPALAEQPKAVRAQAQAAPKAVKKTPDAWAAELGHVKARRLSIALRGVAPGTRYSSEHRRAATAHGWDRNDLQGFAPIFLTCSDYEAAIKAATVGAQHAAALAQCARRA